MKARIGFLIVALMLGCSSETPTKSEPEPTGTVDWSQLVGRWRYEEIQITPNTPIMQEFQQIQGLVIELRADSTYTLPASGFNPNGRFRMVRGQLLLFDLGILDEQFKEVTELTENVLRGNILVMSDDGGSWQRVGTARFRCSRVRN